MQLIGLSIHDVLRVVAVELSPNGELFVVGGDNEQGKTSIIDAIQILLGGLSSKTHPEPVHRGADKGVIVGVLDETPEEGKDPDPSKRLIVTKILKPDGSSSLKIENPEGLVYKRPQDLLNAFVGRISFDPLAWFNAQPKEQVELYKQALGLDWKGLDAEAEKVFADRTAINRSLDQAKARLAGVPVFPEDTPDVEISAADLLGRLQAVQERVEQRDGYLQNQTDTVDEIAKLEGQIAELQQQLAVKQELLASLQDAIVGMADEGPALAALREQINTVDATNQAVRNKAQKAVETNQVNALTEQSKAKTGRLDAIKAEKLRQVAEAPATIPGLSIEDDQMLYQGHPVQQASGAQRIGLSMEICAALNPKLRLALIRDGSLLDQKHLTHVQQIARERKMLVVMERVSKGRECNVIIEDGRALSRDEMEALWSAE